MRASYRGHVFTNEASPFVFEYFERKSAAKLGFVSSYEEIDCITMQAFEVISNEMARLEDEDRKKARKKR